VEVTCTDLVLVRIQKKINNDRMRREVAVGKVTAHLCLTLIIKELKFSVEHDRVVTTLNIIFSAVNWMKGYVCMT
jgi:hypothetical protein